MRTFIPGFLFFCLYAVFARWYFICEVRGHCGESEVESVRLKTLDLREGETVILEGFDQFYFEPDSILPDLNENNGQFLDAVVSYLQSNPEKKLTLTGRYLESERYAKAGFFENIGLARAAQIEFLLEERGVLESRMYLDHEALEGDSLPEPILFRIPLPDTSGYRKLQFSFKDMTYSDANFAYNSDVFTPGEGFVNYADSVKIFLDLHPDYRMLIIGHTDSIASEQYNEDLGLRRARSAQAYFRNLGVTSDIHVLSRGETEPVAPNTLPDGSDNPEGRQKNRRVNVKLESTEEVVE